MTAIKKVITVNGKIQYHEFKPMQMRSFRISAADAELKIATGESYLVDKFFYEQSEEVAPVTEIKETPSNVVSFADRLKVKKDNADLEKAKAHFTNNILPSMTTEEKQKILFNPDMMQEILIDVMLRIQIRENVKTE